MQYRRKAAMSNEAYKKTKIFAGSATASRDVTGLVVRADQPFPLNFSGVQISSSPRHHCKDSMHHRTCTDATHQPPTLEQR